jgi:hypothetical protein
MCAAFSAQWSIIYKAVELLHFQKSWVRATEADTHQAVRESEAQYRRQHLRSIYKLCRFGSLVSAPIQVFLGRKTRIELLIGPP